MTPAQLKEAERKKRLHLEEERRNGFEAQFILEHPVFVEAWQGAIDGLESQRRKVALKDSDMHTRLIMAEQVLRSVRSALEQTMKTGKMADIQLREPTTVERMAQRLGLRD